MKPAFGKVVLLHAAKMEATAISPHGGISKCPIECSSRS